MERERLTITLRRDILKLVDQSIDGAKLRNRSHAIEYFLSRELSPKSVKVVIAVPGGMRTSYQAGGMPIGVRGTMTPGQGSDLKGIFQTLAAQNFKDVVLIGIDSTALQAAAVDAEKVELDVKTEVVDVAADNVAGSAFTKVREMVSDETFIYWDSRFSGDINLSDFLDFHKATQGEATAVLATNTDLTSLTGVTAAVYGRRIIDLGEGARAGRLPMMGVFAFESKVVSALGSGRAMDLYKDILPNLVREGKLHAFVFTASEMAKQAVGAR